jgi:1-acyl-sn-glycerol-3-phosphate acyltransferase
VSKLNYYRRLFCTFLSFGLFGLGGLTIGITLFPVFYALPVRREMKIALSRRVVRASFRLFIEFMKTTGVLTYEIHGAERLRGREGLFIVANHPTLIDVVFLISVANLPNCVVKKGVWNNPFMFFVVRSAGFIENNGDPETLITRCERTLAANNGLVLFPEGTRTTPNGKIAIKRGAAHVALRAGKNITPVHISCHPITLTKSHRWYNIPPKTPPHFCITVDEDIDIGAFSDQGCAVGARRLNERLTHIFESRNAAHATS